MTHMDQFFPAPGIGVSRTDISKRVYQERFNLCEATADDKAARLTDDQMKQIAESFTESFFEMRQGTININDDGNLYPSVLNEAYRWCEEDSTTWVEP